MRVDNEVNDISQAKIRTADYEHHQATASIVLETLPLNGVLPL